MKYIAAGLIAFLVVGALSLATAYPIKLLWNDTMPELFKLPAITYGQALRLALLCGLLFSSSSSSK